MSPDEATAWMDTQESKARSEAIDIAIEGLRSQGLSKEAAVAVAGAMSQGVSMKDIAAAAGPLSEIKQVDGGLSDGKHALPWERFSTAELKTVAGIGKGFMVAGPVLEFVAAYQDVQNGAPPGKTWGEAIGSVGGSTVGGMGVGLLGGAMFGPPGMFVGAIVGGLAVGAGGKELGGNWGERYDK